MFDSLVFVSWVSSSTGQQPEKVCLEHILPSNNFLQLLSSVTHSLPHHILGKDAFPFPGHLRSDDFLPFSLSKMVDCPRGHKPE